MQQAGAQAHAPGGLKSGGLDRRLHGALGQPVQRRPPPAAANNTPDAVGLPQGSYQLHDELTGDRYTWEGEAGWVRLDPTTGQVAHVFSVTA